MLWTFKGKHEGKDINDVPEDYLQWAMDSSKNPETKALATKILAYRNSGNSMPGRTSTAASSKGTPEAGLRSRVLELAIQMDVKNPWPYLKPIKDYIETGQLPNLTSMLGADEPKPVSEQDDPFAGLVKDPDELSL